MQNKIYRAGILGMGNMGRAHAGNLRQIEDVELVALCSWPLEDAKAYAEQNGLACTLYTDGFAMIEQEQLDILYVCLPPFAHSGQIEAAAAKGIHIFAEKPIALRVADGKKMADAVRQAGVHSQVGYHMRFGGAVQALHAKIADGSAGAPTLFTARYECNSLHTPWWIDVEKCGGQVFEQVIHLYDMSIHFMGAPQCASGFTANLQHKDTPGYTVEDTSVSSIRFASGALGGIAGSNCAMPGEWNATFRVVCQNLVADFTDQNHALFTYTGEGEKRVETLAFESNAMLAEDEYFLNVVRGKAQPFATLQDGYTGLQMVGAVVESSGSDGAPVQIV